MRNSWKVLIKSSGSPVKVLWSLDNVLMRSSESPQIILKKSSENPQKVLRKSSERPQKVIRYSWESLQNKLVSFLMCTWVLAAGWFCFEVGFNSCWLLPARQLYKDDIATNIYNTQQKSPLKNSPGFWPQTVHIVSTAVTDGCLPLLQSGLWSSFFTWWPPWLDSLAPGHWVST